MDKIRRRGDCLIKILHDLLEGRIKKSEVKNYIEVKKATKILTAVYFHSLIAWLKSESDFFFSRDISGKIDLLFEGIGD